MKTQRRRARKAKTPSAGVSAPKLQRNEVLDMGIPGFRSLRYRAKLRYYDVVTLSTGAGSAGTYVYAANGLYDPDITSTGHQPMPFDQLMLSFNHYVVLRATCTCAFKNASTTNTVGVGLSISGSPTPVSVYGALIENGTMVRDRLPVSPASETLKTLTISCDIGKFGSVRDLLDNPYYQGDVSTNPAEMSYFHISAWCPDGVSVVSGIVCEVEILYDAWFFEPRKNSLSLEKKLKTLILEELAEDFLVKKEEEKKKSVTVDPFVTVVHCSHK